MSKSIIGRYDFNTICAGVLRLAKDPSMYRKYAPFIHPKWVYYNDNSEERKALRDVIGLMRLLSKEGRTELFSWRYIEGQIPAKKVDEKQAIELKNYFNNWIHDDEINFLVDDDGAFESFLDYIKILQIAKISSDFNNNFQTGDITNASNLMQEALHDIGKIGAAEAEVLNAADIFSILEEEDNTHDYNTLFLGLQPLDDNIGGFPIQTLNLFIAPTNGGKTAMCHHLIRRCVTQKIPVWVGVLEDRKKSFIYKLLSCLTGIPSRRIKRNYKDLSSQEMELLRQAQEDINKYVRAEFIYGADIEVVHKLAKDWDTYCNLNKMAKPAVNIVDYTGHIAEGSRGDKMYEKLRNAYAARKNFALKYNKICFDFAQVNREGSRAARNEDVLSHDSLAGSFDLAQVCDNIISISRSEMDVSEGKSKLKIVKARDGMVNFTFRVNVDFSRTRYLLEGDANWEYHGSQPKSGVQNEQKTTTA